MVLKGTEALFPSGDLCFNLDKFSAPRGDITIGVNGWLGSSVDSWVAKILLEEIYGKFPDNNTP